MRGILLLCSTAMALLVSCSPSPRPEGRGAKQQETIRPQPFTLKVRRPQIVETKTYNGFLLGSATSDPSMYVWDEDNADIATDMKNNPGKGARIIIHQIDKGTGNVSRTIYLNRGEAGTQSPSDFYNPAQVARLADRHYLFDLHTKIAAFGPDFDLLYAIMFQRFKNFAAFELDGRQLRMAVAERTQTDSEICLEVALYDLFQYKKPRKKAILHRETYDIRSHVNFVNNRRREGEWAEFLPQPAMHGFTKGVKLYFASRTRPEYWIFDLRSMSKRRVALDYLKGRRFTRDEAERLARYKSEYEIEKSEKRYNHRLTHYPVESDVFLLGLLDAGNGRLAVVSTDLDLQKMEMRLDILQAESGTYIESLLLPMSWSTGHSLGNMGPYLYPFILDLDRGIFVFDDRAGEDLEYVARLCRFR